MSGLDVGNSAANRSIGSTTGFHNHGEGPYYAKRVLTPRSLNVKLGPRRNYHKGRAPIRHYANQIARPL